MSMNWLNWWKKVIIKRIRSKDLFSEFMNSASKVKKLEKLFVHCYLKQNFNTNLGLLWPTFPSVRASYSLCAVPSISIRPSRLSKLQYRTGWGPVHPPACVHLPGPGMLPLEYTAMEIIHAIPITSHAPFPRDSELTIDPSLPFW